jgi:hypothetical protein
MTHISTDTEGSKAFLIRKDFYLTIGYYFFCSMIKYLFSKSAVKYRLGGLGVWLKWWSTGLVSARC